LIPLLPFASAITLLHYARLIVEGRAPKSSPTLAPEVYLGE